jgi:hypothetical protein
MAEPREMRTIGGPQATEALQVPEIVAKISERSCPVGWELELVTDAETGEPWGYCAGCAAAWRIRGGAVEFAWPARSELERRATSGGPGAALEVPAYGALTVTWGEGATAVTSPVQRARLLPPDGQPDR